MNQNLKLVSWFLKGGIAFAFLYAAFSGFYDPINWIGFMPQWIVKYSPFSLETSLYIFSSYEVLLAIWVLSGYRQFYSGILAAIVAAIIVLLNLNILIITFRDVAIITSALALAFLHREEGL